MERIINYSYRGILKSCNYTCSYCPFSKTTASQADIEADRHALFRFCEYIAGLPAAPGSLQILLLPYGEGMIHPHYTDALSCLSCIPAVRRVSCQTNLSWDIGRFIHTVQSSGGDLSRISFWCSFHPQCTELGRFVSQCNQFTRHGIAYCAGMVAKPGFETLAAQLRQALPPRVYMWLNRMDGLKRPYTSTETDAFSSIDPFFGLSLENPIPDRTFCRGNTEALFVQADGRTAPCPIARKFSGNIYTQQPAKNKKHCHASYCDCYLAYSNRTDSGLTDFFGQGTFLRIPQRTEVKHFFLDIDGTLTDAKGRLLPGITKTLSILANSGKLYFATEQPYLYVRQKYKALLPLFCGGIFAGGAHIRLFQPIQNHYFYLSENILSEIDSLLTAFSIPTKAIRRYHTFSGIYRIAITDNLSQEFLHRLTKTRGIAIQKENKLLTIISGETDKGKALTDLLHRTGQAAETTLAIGNSPGDMAMFQAVTHSVSVPGSPWEVCHAADITMPVHLLPVFFGF